MKLGFLTALLSDIKLEKMVEWAERNNFDCLEIAVWPPGNGKKSRYWGTTIDVTTLDEPMTKKVKELFASYSLEISSFAYYDNNLDHDPKRRESVHKHLRKAIKAASVLGVDLVGTFVGRDPTKSIEENLKMAGEIFSDLVRYAENLDVKLMIENCPMVGWQMEGLIGNVAYAPFTWDELFSRIPSENFGLNYDPSHLIWQQIDYCGIMSDFASRIFHCHAKDIEIIEKKLAKDGIYSVDWWVPRIPGSGHIDWEKFVDSLRKIGYDGAISIELEDPLWEENEKKVKEGLSKAANYLRPIMGE